MTQRLHHVIGGGTFAPVRGHLALSSMAFGTTARILHDLLQKAGEKSQLHLTKMADPVGSQLVTNDDVSRLTDKLMLAEATGIVFFNPALADFDGTVGDVPACKTAPRMNSRESDGAQMQLHTADKVIQRIRAGKTGRKDVFLVGFKATSGATEDEQYQAGLRLLKEGSCNLVLANDIKTRKNMIIVPEEARYCVTTDRQYALRELVNMALARFDLNYTRSTVVDGPRVDWGGSEVPESLRSVVDHCIQRGAYKPFRGKTAGHFASRGVQEGEFLTSARGENFNQLAERGLVRVFAEGDDEVIAIGAKPSVGGQSQRIIFNRFEDLDCIVHFHCPAKKGSPVNVREQKPYECGSHECGENTANGLVDYGDGIYAVMLDNHGPNIVFNRDVPPEKVIAFIEENFDLGCKTGGRFDLLESDAG
jgi:hypothetical protein